MAVGLLAGVERGIAAEHVERFDREAQGAAVADRTDGAGMGIGTDKEYVETNEGKLIDAKGATARYIRLYSQGSTSSELNHYTEVEVYGTKN